MCAVEESFREWVCKPSFVPATRRVTVIYLDQPLPTGSPAWRDATYPPAKRPQGRSYSGQVRLLPTGCLVLQAVGFTLPTTSPPPRCALTAPFHHCLCSEEPSAVCFLWHFPWGTGPPFCDASQNGNQPPVAVNHHRALSCSDFPPAAKATSDRPTHSWNRLLIIGARG